MSVSPGGPPRMHAGEVMVDDDLVRTLVSTQFPRWADLPLRRVPSTGTDNAIYRLGDELGVRLPRVAVDQVRKEQEWLPRLAPDLPAAVPEPVAIGGPGAFYPYPWLVYRWLPGRDALAGPVPDWARGRGWTLQQAVLFIPYYARTIPVGVAAARRRLDAVLEDDRRRGTDG